MNNLRQLGQGFRIWATDHGDAYPPLVEVQDGGTRLHPLGMNAWLHFAVASNELRTPKILTCPADTESRLATNFSTLDGGLLHPDFRDKAISYFIAHPYPDFPREILAGDRNLKTDQAAGCNYFISTGSYSISGGLSWDSAIHHYGAGNTLIGDGTVQPFSVSSGLATYIFGTLGDSSFHLVRPH